MHAREVLRLLATIVAVPPTLLALLAVRHYGPQGIYNPLRLTSDPETVMWFLVAWAPVLLAAGAWVVVWRLRPAR